MNSKDFDFIRLFIKNHSAIELELGKEYLVEARLHPLVKEMGLTSVAALISQLKERPTEVLKQKIIDAMATNETLFFRDIHPFELLKNIILPRLIDSRTKEKKLVIWCAAASSGQEPYSIAMIINELEALLAGWTIQFIATDISEKILTRAREGVYSQLEINRGLPMAYLLKYFTKEGPSWRITQGLRNLVEFRKVNVAKDWPLIKADLVFMRNILIYFDLPTKKQIFKRLQQLLPDDGYLFLGSSETILGVSDDFERIGVEKAPCYQKKSAHRALQKQNL